MQETIHTIHAYGRTIVLMFTHVYALSALSAPQTSNAMCPTPRLVPRKVENLC